jgi:hypothetical protein
MSQHIMGAPIQNTHILISLLMHTPRITASHAVISYNHPQTLMIRKGMCITRVWNIKNMIV